MARVKKADETAEETLTGNHSQEMDLSQFDYKNLTGENFKNYMLFVEQLQRENPFKKFVFEAYKVDPVKKVRYKGVKDSPVDVVGLNIAQDKPIKQTTIPIKAALEFNGTPYVDSDGDFFTVIGGQWQHNGGNNLYKGTYYLLKK